MRFKDIVYFVTQTIPDYLSTKFQRKKKAQTDKQEKTSWIEDFDERERNWK